MARAFSDLGAVALEFVTSSLTMQETRSGRTNVRLDTSLRYPKASGALLSLFYGVPPAEDRQGPSAFQAYLGYIESPESKGIFRRELLARAPFTNSGKHTLFVEVTQENAVTVRKEIPGLLKIAKQLVSAAE